MNDKKKLRSQEWFGRDDFNGFLHRRWLKNQGWPADLFEGKPVVGIAEAVKRGVWEAGGFPLEFPVMSLGEPLMRPTSMLFRNLVSMDVEESIRANPLDGVVLLMGRDKTTPALLMGAASCDLLTIGLSGGPMLSGKFRGREFQDWDRLGSEVACLVDLQPAGKHLMEDSITREACPWCSKHCWRRA
jgi:L-arabonate dehydrase